MKNHYKQPEPPPDHPNLMFWFRLIWILMIVALFLAIRTTIVEPEYQFDNCRNDGQNALQITKSSILPQAPPYIVSGETRAILIEDIIPCESNGDPLACNKEFGCRAGMGLCGFIASTWNETLNKMSCSGIYDTKKCVKSYMPERCWEKVSLPVSKEKTEMIFDGECNRLAGKWLLENEGSQHWGTAETVGIWGSYSCWSK